jgi:hypothetical protein
MSVFFRAAGDSLFTAVIFIGRRRESGARRQKFSHKNLFKIMPYKFSFRTLFVCGVQ